MRFLTNYAKSCDLRSIMRNRNIAEYQKPWSGHETSSGNRSIYKSTWKRACMGDGGLKLLPGHISKSSNITKHKSSFLREFTDVWASITGVISFNFYEASFFTASKPEGRAPYKKTFWSEQKSMPAGHHLRFDRCKQSAKNRVNFLPCIVQFDWLISDQLRYSLNIYEFYDRGEHQIHFLLEGLPGVLGNKGTKGKYRREQGNMTPVLGNTGT